jgi:raffinose/stachyose/melibiose transport system permease protein
MKDSLKKYYGIFALPTTAIFAVIFLIPFILGLYLSFCEFTTVSDSVFTGLSNYKEIFTDENFRSALWFTVRFTIVSVISVNVIAFSLALLLSNKIRGRNFFRTVFFMPNLIGGIVLGYIWQLIINGILSAIGVTITYDPSYGFWGLVVLMNWQMIGYMMIIYIAGLQSVPNELIESSKIDGATKWQTLKNVTIPMVMPSITICTFLTLSNSFKLYDQNLALTNGAPMHKTEMLALNIVNTFYGRNGYQGVGQAKAVVFFVIVAVIALSQLYFTRKREVEQ